MEWINFLDTSEKMLIAGAMVSLVLAATAPAKLPFGISIPWTIGGRRTLAAAGLLFLALSYPPLREVRFTSDEDTRALAQQYEHFIVERVKGKVVPAVHEARTAVWGASTNTSDAAGCTTAAVEGMKKLDVILTDLNNIVLDASKISTGTLPSGAISGSQ